MMNDERFQPPSPTQPQAVRPDVQTQPTEQLPQPTGAPIGPQLPNTNSTSTPNPAGLNSVSTVSSDPVNPTTPNSENPAGLNAAQGTGEFPWTQWEAQRTQARQRRRPGWAALIAASIAAALAGGGIGIGTTSLMDDNPRPATLPTTSGGTTSVVTSTAPAPDWQAVADEVGNSVVAIDVTSPDGQSQGSGVIIDSGGLILTNEHVVAGAENLFVTLADSRVFEATTVGEDQATDLAVIELKDAPDDLTVAQLGDSTELSVGQPVAAIGNPMGLASTLTTGVISALDRPTQPSSGDGAITNAIQLDAAINPGNSGGPVFDAQGRVVGIASSIISVASDSRSAGSIGLGFAIPINLAKNISAQLIENGVAEHAYLGVTITNGLAEYDSTRRQGAEINSVQPGTPADLAGIQAGDVIIDIDGRAVPTSISLTGYVRQYISGDVVTLTLERDGALLEVDVTLATKQD